MEASPFSFTPERYWTEEKERALIAYFSSKSHTLYMQLYIPQKVAVIVDGLSEPATFVGNRCSTRATAVSNEQYRCSNGD